MPDLWGGFPDYYRILRAAPDASEGESRTAWRNAAKRWHPDTNSGRDTESMMRRVNEAWEVLSNREARAVYDEVYYTWRTGSEHLSAELSGRLDAQKERRRSRATSAEWTRWGREDRGRWERNGGDGPRSDVGPRPASHGNQHHERERSASAPTEADATDETSRSRGNGPAWATVSVVAIVVIVLIVIVITQSY